MVSPTELYVFELGLVLWAWIKVLHVIGMLNSLKGGQAISRHMPLDATNLTNTSLIHHTK